MIGDNARRLRSIATGETDWLLDAADEIERLRAELDLAKKWQENYKLAFEKCQKMLFRS